MEETKEIYKPDCIANGIPMKFICDTGASNVSI
jgi:predicted aspartyl protease